MSLGDAERHDTPKCEYARVGEGEIAPFALTFELASSFSSFCRSFCRSFFRKRPPRLPTLLERWGRHLFLATVFQPQSPRQIPRSRAVWTVSESSGTVFMSLMASVMRTGTICGGW
jgi:hypothetical protein